MPFRTDAPAIKAEDLIWEQTGTDTDDPDEIEEGIGPHNRLLAHIVIAGQDMHLEAHEIRYTESFVYEAVDPVKEEYIGTLMSFEETKFQVTEINGRNYVLVALPYGD